MLDVDVDREVQLLYEKMSSFFEFPIAPLQLTQSLFREGGCGHVMSSLGSTISDLETSGHINEVPLLNDVNAVTRGVVYPTGTLVRYRGMVQDQFDPEYYLKQFTVINHNTGEKDVLCGLYNDIVNLQPGFEIDYECSDNITGDRQTLYVVPIPGESQWSRTGEGLVVGMSNESSSTRCAKRLHEDTDSKGSMEEGENGGEEHMDTGDDREGVEGDGVPVKKMKNGSDNITSSGNNTGPISLNNPLPGETRSPCLVKIYDGIDQQYPLNSVFEFVGVLSSDPALAKFEVDQPPEDQMGGDIVDPFGSESTLERRTHCPPPSLIPRLHCIKATPLHHCHPNLPISLTPQISNEVLVQHGCNVTMARQNLIDLFTTVLMGDQLAAEFLLLSLLSSVFGRTEVLAIGKLSLNISQCPRRSATPLPAVVYKLLSQLVTKSHFLPLTVANLNSSKFIPKKDYEANKLQTGLLQLSPGTHLLVDETVMQPGRLDEKGVVNLAALGGVVQSQLVKYDFKYHQQEFNCDLPVIIFSEGKSLIKVDCHVPLSITTSDPAGEIFPDPLTNYTDKAVSEMRKYLVLCKLLKYDLDTSIRETLQEDFVQRKHVDPSMTGDTFHYLLNLSRLITISHGEERLSMKHWEQAKVMYIKQRQRTNT